MYTVAKFASKIIEEGTSSHAAVTLDAAAELLDLAQRVRAGTTALRTEFRSVWRTYIACLQKAREHPTRGKTKAGRLTQASQLLNAHYPRDVLSRFHTSKSARGQGKTFVTWTLHRLRRLLKLEAHQDLEGLVAFIEDVRLKRAIPDTHPLRYVGTMSPTDIIGVLAFKLLQGHQVVPAG